jgi:large subunit ribosomal protein L15
MAHDHLLPAVTTKSNKRLGRGYGSGKGGHTSSRGTKGQKSRQGAKIPLWFEGGNLRLIKRLPMLRGKGRLKPVGTRVEITLSDLQVLSQETITMDTLQVTGLVPHGSATVKIIANGAITRPVTIEGLRVSAAARAQIEKAGGKVL